MEYLRTELQYQVMEKKDQLTLVQTHCLGQKTEDQLLLKQIKNFNL